MKVFVIDNGRDYSDHHLYFLETPLSPERVDRLVYILNADDEGLPRTGAIYAVIATGELHPVRDGLSTISAHGLMDTAYYGWGNGFDDEVKAIDAEERALLEAM